MTHQMIEVSSKHAFWTHQPLLQVSKNVDHSFYFLRTGIKISQGLYSRWLIKSMFWVLQNAVVWADVWELALSWWRMIRLLRLVFLISWKTTGQQMAVYHSEFNVLRCSSGTIATFPVFPKNRQSFAWKCFVCEKLLLDLTHLETPIQSAAVYFQAHTRKSTIHNLPQCHRRVSKQRDPIFGAFLSPNRPRAFFFWAIDKLCEIQCEQIFLTFKCSCNIECMLVPLMPKVVSISR